MDIKIRHSEPGDAEAFQEIYAQPRALWGTLQLPFPSLEKWREKLSSPSDGLYSLVAEVNGQVVGNLALHHSTSPRRRHTGSLGMGVHDEWQGQGVGTALMEAAIDLADKWLNLTRLELQVFTDNEPAVHLYRKFGFESEGTLRRFAFRDGEYADVYTMARLRGDAEG